MDFSKNLIDYQDCEETLFWENFLRVSNICKNFNPIYQRDFYLYQKEYCISNKSLLSEKSFLIFKNKKVVCGAIFLLTKSPNTNNPEINFGNNFPGIILISDEFSGDSIKVLQSKIHSLLELANKIIFTIPMNNILNKGYESILNKFKFTQEIIWSKSIYTNKKDEYLWRDIRKSYKSPINRGLKEQSFQIIDKFNLDEKKFKQIKDLHFKISGRKTRSDKSWDLQYSAIKNDSGFALTSFGEDKNDLYSAVYFYKTNHHAYYGTGLYTDYSKKYLYGYSIIWKAIVYCLERNITLCELDDNVKFKWISDIDKKLVDISFLKGGFGGNLSAKFIFSIKR